MTEYQGIVRDLDEATYHSLPALSSTGAKKLLRSPAHYRHYIDHPHEDKPEFDLGSAVHAKVLGVGASIAVYPDGEGTETFEYDGEVLRNVLAANGAISTKAAKEFAASARRDGLIPVKRAVARKVDRIAESVLRNHAARRLLENFEPEVSIFATDPVTGVDLRGRIDAFGRQVIDLKTTAGEASEIGFAGLVFRHGYDVQFGHYDFILEQLGEQRGWLWIVVETEPPYVSAVHTLNEDVMQMGRDRARVARERLARALETGEWPGYENASGGPIGIIRPPMWAVYEYQDLIEGEEAA